MVKLVHIIEYSLQTDCILAPFTEWINPEVSSCFRGAYWSILGIRCSWGHFGQFESLMWGGLVLSSRDAFSAKILGKCFASFSLACLRCLSGLGKGRGPRCPCWTLSGGTSYLSENGCQLGWLVLEPRLSFCSGLVVDECSFFIR